MKSIIPYPRLRTLPGYIKEYGVDDIRTTASIWRDAINLVQETKPELNNFYEVRYEDILKSPRKELGKLFDFCELDWPDNSNKNFHDQFSRIGVVQHKNRYQNFEVVEQFASAKLKEFNYL